MQHVDELNCLGFTSSATACASDIAGTRKYHLKTRGLGRSLDHVIAE